MGWCKITRNREPGSGTAYTLAKVIRFAAEIDELKGKPSDFVIFSTTTFDSEGNNPRSVLYFSPVASSLCGELLKTFAAEHCDKPIRDPEMAVYYGVKDGSDWDLLK